MKAESATYRGYRIHVNQSKQYMVKVADRVHFFSGLEQCTAFIDKLYASELLT